MAGWISALPAMAYEPTYSLSRALGGTNLASAVDLGGVRVNPASISQGRKYLVGGAASFGFEPRTLGLAAGILDSQTADIAMGADYQYARFTSNETRALASRPPKTVHSLHGAVAQFYKEKVHIGIGGHYDWYRVAGDGELHGTWNLAASVVTPIDPKWLRATVLVEDPIPQDDPIASPFTAGGLSMLIEQRLAINFMGGWRWDEEADPFEAGGSAQVTLWDQMEIAAFGKWLPYRGRKEFRTGGGLAWHDPSIQVATDVRYDSIDRVGVGLSIETRLFKR